MRTTHAWLVVLVTACHATAMQDTTLVAEPPAASAAAPEVSPVAPVALVAPVASPEVPAASALSAPTWAEFDRPLTYPAPLPEVEAPAHERYESLVERVQALEGKIARLEAAIRAASAPEELVRPGIYSTWTLIALTLTMLIAVAAAIVAIAHAHRARSELSRMVRSLAE